MKYDEWKDAKIMMIYSDFGAEKVTVNEYAWINALSSNISIGIVATIILITMFDALEITPFMAGVAAVAMVVILTVGTFFLKEAYIKEAIDEIQITELCKNSKHGSED